MFGPRATISRRGLLIGMALSDPPPPAVGRSNSRDTLPFACSNLQQPQQHNKATNHGHSAGCAKERPVYSRQVDACCCQAKEACRKPVKNEAKSKFDATLSPAEVCCWWLNKNKRHPHALDVAQAVCLLVSTHLCGWLVCDALIALHLQHQKTPTHT